MMRRESYHEAVNPAAAGGDTVIDPEIAAAAERETLRHEAYQRAQEILQARIDKYEADSPKPRVPGAAYQGPNSMKPLSAGMIEDYRALADLKAGRGNDADVRRVLASEREKTKALIASEEERLRLELYRRMHGNGPGIDADELQRESVSWKNSPANAALNAEIAGLDKMISSLEAAN